MRITPSRSREVPTATETKGGSKPACITQLASIPRSASAARQVTMNKPLGIRPRAVAQPSRLAGAGDWDGRGITVNLGGGADDGTWLGIGFALSPSLPRRGGESCDSVNPSRIWASAPKPPLRGSRVQNHPGRDFDPAGSIHLQTH